MSKTQITRTIDAAGFSFRQGLCTTMKVIVNMGNSSNQLFGMGNQPVTLTEGDLYRILDTGNYEIVEFPDGIEIRQEGIWIGIKYNENAK